MWFLLALGSGLFQVLRNMVMKRLGHALDETINVWGRFTFLLPFTAAAVAVNGVPPLGDGLWTACLLFALTQIVATLSLSKALKLSDISLVTALWKLNLVLVVVWGALALDERPSIAGLGGVVLSMAGVYLLNVQRRRTSPWAPLAALVTDPGQRYALLAAFFIAPSIILIKRIVLLSDPYFGTFIAYVFASALITPYTLYRSGPHFAAVGRHWPAFAALGLFAAISTVLGSMAYELALSSYVEAAKQVEILFALAIGWAVFQERARVRAIWPGAVLMLAGLVLLKLWG